MLRTNYGIFTKLFKPSTLCRLMAMPQRNKTRCTNALLGRYPQTPATMRKYFQRSMGGCCSRKKKSFPKSCVQGHDDRQSGQKPCSPSKKDECDEPLKHYPRDWGNAPKNAKCVDNSKNSSEYRIGSMPSICKTIESSTICKSVCRPSGHPMPPKQPPPPRANNRWLKIGDYQKLDSSTACTVIPDELCQDAERPKSCDVPTCPHSVLKRKPCEPSKKGPADYRYKTTGFKSIWQKQIRDCCPAPCPEFPRFDCIYYRTSDKKCRLYRQTWVECPEIKVVPKVVCCFDREKLPPLEKRQMPCREQTACPQDLVKLSKLCKMNAECPKFDAPCCSKGRYPPCCKRIVVPSDCSKVPCPYPAFSECSRPNANQRRSSECHECNRPVAKCEVIALEQYRKAFQLK